MRASLIVIVVAVSIVAAPATSAQEAGYRDEKVEAAIRNLKIGACARFLTTMAMIRVGKEMRLSPSLMQAMIAADPAGIRRRMMEAMGTSVESMVSVMIVFWEGDEAEKQEMLGTCAKGFSTLYGTKLQPKVREAPKPPKPSGPSLSEELKAAGSKTR